MKPALTIYLWATGADWDKVINVSGLAEGDLARLIMRTADNLNHISNLHEPFPVIAASASKAYYMIMKEPVVTDFT
jgi:superfamily II RNA helicase